MDKVIEKLELWKDVFIKNIPNIAIALVVLVIAYFASRNISSLINRTIGSKIKQKSVNCIWCYIFIRIVFCNDYFKIR